MSWHHARRAVRKRIAKNKRRYEEAPLRDALEAQAIRALNEAAKKATAKPTKAA